MKRLLTLTLLILFWLAAFAPAAITLADSIRAPRRFSGKLWNGTFALYGSKGKVSHFVCTAEVIRKSEDGYVLMSAGHCVQDIPAGISFSVAENISGPLMPVTVVKVYEGDGIDFALFNLKTTKTYPVFSLGTEQVVRVGDKTINPNFTLGIGKQLSYGVVSSQEIVKSEECDIVDCLGHFLVQEYAGSGASGSAVFSAKTHKVIGILVFEFTDGNPGFAVEPISMFTKFLAGPNQPHPVKTEAKIIPEQPIVPDPITIPTDDFTALFGVAHPFTLTTTGADFTFVQAGYKFFVETDGFELAEEYYYKVPVFIELESEGTYRLTSTKDGVGVSIVALAKTEK